MWGTPWDRGRDGDWVEGRDIEVRTSGLGEGTGLGAFALRGVASGVRARVGVYEGERLEGMERDVLQGRQLGSVARVKEGVWIDGAVGGNWCQRVQGGGGKVKNNLRLYSSGGIAVVGTLGVKIAPGDELFMGYGASYWRAAYGGGSRVTHKQDTDGVGGE